MPFQGRNRGPTRASAWPQPPVGFEDRFRDPEPADSAARLERLAEVRPAVVRRGRRLLADPDFPGPEILRRISRLLARHLVA